MKSITQCEKAYRVRKSGLRQHGLAIVLLTGLLMLICPAMGQKQTKAGGAALFATQGCAHCHGETGEGTDSGPSLRDVHRKLKAMQIRQQIAAGGGAMPAFGTVLDAGQIQALVSFLRSKTWAAAPTWTAAPPPAAK